MFNLLSANILRLQKSKFYLIGLFVTVGYCVFLLIMNYMEKISHIGNSIVEIDYYLFSPFFIVSFFCPIFSSLFIGIQYSDKTMRNIIIMGHTRKNIYLANFLTVCFGNIVIALVSSLIATILGIGMFGWYISNPTMTLLHYFSALMMLTAFSGFFTLLAMTIHSKTISTVTSIIIYLISYIITSIIRRLVYGLYNGEELSDMFYSLSGKTISLPILEFFYDLIPMGQCFQITSNSIMYPFRLPIYSALLTLITITFGILIFSKKDLK